MGWVAHAIFFYFLICMHCFILRIDIYILNFKTKEEPKVFFFFNHVVLLFYKMAVMHSDSVILGKKFIIFLSNYLLILLCMYVSL